jgi:hypothetical protein
MLPYQTDANEQYFYEVVDAACSPHTPCVSLTNVIQMQDGCHAARSEAIKRIKDNTIRYLTAGQRPVKVDERVRYKPLRGLNDPDIGRLLIPAQDLHEWDRDPDA